jgi:hypothetical protein
MLYFITEIWGGRVSSKKERKKTEIEPKRFKKEELKHMNKTTLKITILTVLLATLLVLAIMPVKAYPRIVNVPGIQFYGDFGPMCGCPYWNYSCGCSINTDQIPATGGGGTN